jgi:hypothetical protein
MWYYQSIDGLWAICKHDQRFVLMFNGEYLATGRTPADLLHQVADGGVSEELGLSRARSSPKIAGNVAGGASLLRG